MTDRTLSIFIDESGDFGKYEAHAGHYIVGLVFHEQRNDISENINNFASHLRNIGYEHHAVHTGPLIRREQYYAHDLIETRKRLFNSLFNCARKLPIQYASIDVNKREWQSKDALTIRLSRQLEETVDKNIEYLKTFEHINIYYDNGQTSLTKIISSVFNSHIQNVTFRKVQPIDYLLFQVADLICTMELLAGKAETKAFSHSEIEFFDNIRNFKKNYLKWIRKKHI